MKISELSDRHEREKKFFNKKFKSQNHIDYYSAGFTNIIFERMMEKLGDIENKMVLDFGCGEGWLSKILLRKGAKVWAFDISKEAVKKLRIKSKEFSSKYPLTIDQMTAENLSYDANYFDYIVGTAILHHTDLNASIKEIHRVSKRGGKAYFMEPLGHNPLINWYRKRTPELRSPDEKPLLFDDFKDIKKIFSKFEHEEFYLLALGALFWHFILRNDWLMLKTRDIFINLDNAILRLLPFLRKYCWYSILIMEK